MAWWLHGELVQVCSNWAGYGEERGRCGSVGGRFRNVREMGRVLVIGMSSGLQLGRYFWEVTKRKCTDLAFLHVASAAEKLPESGRRRDR